jgi:hypothetical protein
VRADEETFDRLAQAVPSSAGFYYDQQGKLTVWISDSRDAAAVQAAFRALVGSHEIVLKAGQSQIPELVVKVGSFSFQQLAVWRDSIGGYADNNADAGIASLDLNEARNQLTVGVVPGTSTDVLVARFGRMGVPSSALDLMSVQRMKPSTVHGLASTKGFSASFAGKVGGALPSAMFPIDSLGQTAPSMLGGLEIAVRNGTYGAGCTIGFVVRHIQSGVTKTGFTTASHCTTDVFGCPGSAEM